MEDVEAVEPKRRVRALDEIEQPAVELEQRFPRRQGLGVARVVK
jgi:hypothetical protein